MLRQRDQPNNALKLVQLAELHLAGAPRDDPRVAPLRCQLAVVSARTFAQGNHRRGGMQAGINVARVHVITGEPDAAHLAAQAIQAVLPLRSGVARTDLAFLARDLRTRPGPDFAELARQAQRIATTRI